jgi:hypothetical protein
MSHVFLERVFDDPVAIDDARQMASDSKTCLGIYSAQWHESMLSSDGRKMYCYFEAPDIEAIRNVMRFNNSDYQAIWSTEIHDTGTEGEINVLVERNWDEPVKLEDIASIEETGAWCLEAHNVTFLRTFFATDHKRMICLYRAPDAESVRQAQRKANMPFEDIWSFQHLTPALLFPA